MIEQLMSNVEVYGPIAVVIWMFMEEFLPVPSVLAPMAAAYLLVSAENPYMAFLQVFVIIAILGSAASVLSSYVTYGIAFYGGRPAIDKFGKYIGVSWIQVQAFKRHLTSGNEHRYLALFRAIPLMPLSVISASAGFFRIEWKRYGLWSFIGMVPRNLFLGYLGWYLADDFHEAATLIGQLSTVVFIIGASILLFYFIYRREELKQKYEKSKGLFNP
ncbi:MAG: VTT domain-containing protein [Candidatus Nanohaloarchaea archaeon]